MELHEVELDLDKLKELEISSGEYTKEYRKIFNKYKDINKEENLYIDEYEHSSLIDYLKFFVTLTNKIKAAAEDYEWRM